ncbi:hypothetical protein Drorol1_Dr00016862 [Drosera rotundifolia]
MKRRGYIRRRTLETALRLLLLPLLSSYSLLICLPPHPVINPPYLLLLPFTFLFNTNYILPFESDSFREGTRNFRDFFPIQIQSNDCVFFHTFLLIAKQTLPLSTHHHFHFPSRKNHFQFNLLVPKFLIDMSSPLN